MHKYNLNPDQQAQLLDDLRSTAAAILEINFEDPKVDDQAIRHHAYMKGKLAAFNHILADDFPETDYNPELEGN